MTLPRAVSRPEAGFTFIEIMLVVGVISILMMTASMGLGSLTRSNLRASSMKVAGAVGYAYNRAITNGTTTRVRFDLKKNTIAVEEAAGPVVLATKDDDEEQVDAIDAWARAKERLATPDAPPQATPRFSTVSDAAGVRLKNFDEQPVGDGISVLKVITPRNERGVEDGDVALHFFSGGMTEHAVVQLVDSNDNVFSIEVHPLTGATEIYNYAFEPKELMEEDVEEVRDQS